jgi:hypothetical protein
MSLENYVQWVKAHERLLLVVAGGLVLWFALGKIDTMIEHHDAAALHTAEVTANIQADWNAKQAQIVAQQAAEYKALADKVEAQNAALEAANVTLATALTKQQKTDAALPPTELVARWNTLVPAAGSTVTPTGVALPSTGAIATVQELERVPVLSSQIENDRTQIANDERLIGAGLSEKQSLYAQVDGLKLQIVDDTKVCKAQVAEVKAAARKSKLRWFTIGFITGFISRQIIKP